MLIMQKDLLAELHLPKLNLNSLENIVTQNSKRLACVLKESNEFIKNSKLIPNDLKVVMGNRFLDVDVNLPLSAPGENIEILKRKFIIKRAPCTKEISLENVIEKPPDAAVTNGTTVSHNPVNVSVSKDNFETAESRSLLATNSRSNYTMSPTAANPEKCPVESTETESLMGAYVSGPSDEDSEVQILLDKSSNTHLDLNTTSLNARRSLLKRNLKITEPIVKSSVEEEVSSTSNDTGRCQTTNDSAESSTPAMCIISEVVGNAHTTFAEAEDPQGSADEQTQDTQIITPKKTNDITKIKGWRRKQFFVEKPTTVEFYSVSEGCRMLKKKHELRDCLELNEEPGNKENAFVCDSLDEFLDQEADLKIGYEVPHLYAEYGIKLTSDEIVSRPGLSEKDIEEVGTRYCVPISLPSDNTNLDDIKEEIEEVDIKGVKRPIEDDIKPCKALKIEGCKKQMVKFTQKQTEKFKSELAVNFLTMNRKTEKIQKVTATHKMSNIKLIMKLIALVVYPGPCRPLHPLVQYHLNKLRNYRTAVDENWANFAASAVVDKDSRCKRRVVPAYCCVQVKKNPTDTSVETTQKKVSKKQVKLKECRVVIKRLKPSQMSDPWCMEHNCYDCSLCGLARLRTTGSEPQRQSMLKLQKNIKKRVEKEEDEEEQGETVTISPRASFNKKIARLLAKKVRLLKANSDTLTSIDSLRITKSDTIEFIKLKFVKESFLAGYINIWYLKPDSAAVRSRAFLTFSQSSPVPNAINLKSTGLCLNNLPKVITEIVSVEKTFDSNEYAILHCSGGVWEIHGSLNLTFGNTDKFVEQIFTSLELPELTGLQEIAEKILHVKAVKWWVLDLTQKFRLIEIRAGSHNTVVTRKKFLELIKSNSFGFITLRRDREYRMLGAYIIQRLLPFVLIGPYYLLETRDLTLKGTISTVPFRYYGEDNVTTNYPLKFFINSVIKNLEKKKNKKLEGLWLYDKMCLDKTTYIEVVTSDVDGNLPCKCSVIDIEHGYSLNSLTHTSPSGATSGIVKRKDGKDELQTITIYLYFDIFDLGYLEGELQFDNSVIINHPLDERTKMKSHKIGDWFLSIIRRRVVFIPNDMPVRWFVTKHKEDLRNRSPFNKFILAGAHIVTKRGIFYLLELSEMNIERLGLDKSEILKVMSQCEVLKEVRELKNLAKLLMTNSENNLSMEGVISRANAAIKTLEGMHNNLQLQRASVEAKKLKLASRFVALVDSFSILCSYKIRMIENVEHFFLKENGELQEEFVERLKRTWVGWNYMRHFQRRRGKLCTSEMEKWKIRDNFNALLKLKIWGSPKSKGVNDLIRTLQKLSKSYEGLKKPAVRPLNAESADAVEPTKGPILNNRLQCKQIDKKDYDTNERIAIKHSKILKTLSPVAESSPLQNVEGEKIKNTEIFVISKPKTSPKDNKEGFKQLGSADILPKNIKFCWRNWNVKKMEVT